MENIKIIDSFIDDREFRNYVITFLESKGYTLKKIDDERVSDRVKNNDNDFTIELLLEENKKIKDICHIQGVKDMRQCFISFLSKNKRKRKMIPLATSYALDVLGMEEVFIKTQPNDENMIKYLLESNYECLGDEKGSIIFLKEKNL